MQDDDVETMHWALRNSNASMSSFTRLETIKESHNPQPEALTALQRSSSRGLRSGGLDRAPSMTSGSGAAAFAASLRASLVSSAVSSDAFLRPKSWSHGDPQRNTAMVAKPGNAAAAAAFPAIVNPKQ